MGVEISRLKNFIPFHMASPAASVGSEAVAKKFVAGAASRAIISIIRQKGHITRPGIWELVPKDVIPTKTKLGKIMDYLVAQKRIKVCITRKNILQSS